MERSGKEEGEEEEEEEEEEEKEPLDQQARYDVCATHLRERRQD